MPSTLFMHLKILLPYRCFLERVDISSLVVETQEGLLGLLPLRRDCIAAMVPGILTYKTSQDEEGFVAMDEGILIKTQSEVLISVRNAIGGKDLKQLREAVDQEFLIRTEAEQTMRSILAKMESGLVGRLAEFIHD